MLAGPAKSAADGRKCVGDVRGAIVAGQCVHTGGRNAVYRTPWRRLGP